MSSLKYNTSRLYVSPEYSGNFNSGDLRQLHRVQSSNFDIEIVRNLQASLGSLDVNDSTILESPFVNFTASYFVTDGNNENAIGLITDGDVGSFTSLHDQEKEYYIVTDSFGNKNKVFAIGNAYLNSYSVSAQVDSPVTATFSVRGYNIKLDEGLSGNYQAEVNKKDGSLKSLYTYEIPSYSDGVTPRITGQISSNIIAGNSNITLSLSSGSAFAAAIGTNDVHVQSFELSVNIPRRERIKIGQKYPLNNDINYPIVVTANAEIILSDYQKEQISQVVCKSPEDIVFTINNRCSGEYNQDWNYVSKPKLKYILKGAKLNQQGWNLTVGQRATASISLQSNIGNVHSLRNNLFISGDFGKFEYQLNKVNSLNNPTGISDYGFSPFNKEVTFDLVKVQNDAKTFDLNFTSNFDLGEDFIYPEFIYNGATGVLNYSGNLNPELNVVELDWEVSTWAGKYDLSSNQQEIDVFSGFVLPFNSGYLDNQENVENHYFFNVRSYGWNTGKMSLDLSFSKEGYSGSFLYPEFELDPLKPNYFNCLRLKCTDREKSLNDPVSMVVFAKTPDYSRYYLLKGKSENRYYLGLTNADLIYFNTWIDAYDLNSYSGISGNNGYFTFDQIENKSIYVEENDFETITGVSGRYMSLNNKATIEFTRDDQDVVFQNTNNDFVFDLTNFSLLSLFRTEEYQSKQQIFALESSEGNIGDGFAYGLISGTPFFEDRNGIKTFSGIIDDDWHSHIIRYSGDNLVNLRIDNVDYGNVVLSGSGFFQNINSGLNSFTMFKSTKGELAEFMFSPFTLTEDQVVNYQNYFSGKWNYL